MSGLISFFGGNSSAPAFAGLKGQTSVYGLPIPIVYGRARIAANLIHLLDQAQSTVQSGGKAASKSGATQYALRAAVALALCEGPIAGVISGWADKSGVRDMSRFTAEGWSVALGTSTQAAWSYLTAHHVSEAVPYQLLAYLRNEGLDMPSGSLANYTWEVDGLLAIGGGNFDAHPKDILVDLVTDVNHGLALPATFFGDLSAYQTYCTAAGLFVSPAYTAQRPGIEHFRELFQASYSAPVWSDGKLKVIPYCDTPLTGNAVTYTPNTTPLYDLNDDHFLREGDEEPVRVTRKRAAEAFNQIFVEGEERYINGASAYAPTVGEAKDQASLELGIFRPAPKISLPLIKSVTILRLLAQYLLQRELNVRCEYRFRLGWKFSLLEPMDLVTLTEASFGLTLTPVRITEMHEIDDGWDVVAEDWPFGTASATAYTTQVGSGSAPFQGIAPGNTNTPAIFESPGPLPTDPLEVCIAAAGGVNWGGCDVHVSTDGTTYHKVGTITKRAAYGTLTASLASAPALPAVDSTHTLAVNIAASGAALASGASTDVAALLTLCYVDGEFLSFATASLTGTGLYSLTTLGRGAYATQPRAHSSGSTFVRCDDAVLHLPFPQGVNGQQLWFKLPAFNIYGRALEDISTVPVFTHTIVDVTAQLELRVVPSSAVDGQITLAVYVADPFPSFGVPISLSVEYIGLPDVVPISASMTAPGDPITANLDTTDFVEFVVTQPNAGDPSGVITITATRADRREVVASVTIDASGSYGTPQPTIGPIVIEGTGLGGNGEGLMHIPITFDKNTREIHFFSAEALAAGTANPDTSTAFTSGVCRRLEGVAESAATWTTMWDIGATPSYYRRVIAVPIGPTGLVGDPVNVELQAIDTGTAPTGGPTGISVVNTTVSGFARATISWTCVDALAYSRVKRNGLVIAIVAPTVASYVDDGLTPSSGYQYTVDHYRNGQTSGGSSSTITTSGVPTLVAPTWHAGYPLGFMVGGTDPVVNFRIHNPDPLADTEVWQNSATTDTGPFSTLVLTIPAGATSGAGRAADVGLAAGDQRWFLLISSRAGYTDSAASAHGVAIYGG